MGDILVPDADVAALDRATEEISSGDPRTAEMICRDLFEKYPAGLGVLTLLGQALKVQGRFSEARSLLERCYRHDKSLALTLGITRLGAGDYAAGWPLYDARLKAQGFNTELLAIPQWQGEPIAGKTLLVWREQGFGDMIQCSRFLPVLRSMGARVFVVTLPQLVRLFASMGFEATSISDNVNLPAKPDFYAHPFSIPRWLGVRVDSVPAASWIRATPRGRGGVGIVWRGRPSHAWDRYRSLVPAQAARLLALPGVIELTAEALGANDFADTAEVIAGLDHVISVDTAVAHLAGALGKPVSLMISGFGQDWRWLEHRHDSPWYPTAKLYRQTTPGDWAPVVDRVIADLS